MYASDYGYSTSATDAECESTIMYSWNGSGNVENCKNNSWIYNSSSNQWTISLASSYEYSVFGVSRSGSVEFGITNAQRCVRPAIYLKQNVKITAGLGSEESPFELSM